MIKLHYFLKKNGPKHGLALLLVSVLLHLCFIQWAGGRIGIPEFQRNLPPVVEIKLHPADKSPLQIPAPAPIVKNMPVPKPPVIPGQTSISLQAEMQTPSDVPEPEEGNVPPVSPVPQMPAVSAEDGIALTSPEPPEEDKINSYKVNPPPSLALRYKVEAVRDGQTIYGSSTMRWVNNGRSYSIDGETTSLFFSLLYFKSEGVIDAYGVSPQLYSEKRFGKAETNTHFHRERNTISFSASTASYPRKGGEQDRASIIWQLAGIGRGNKENIFPGATLNFFVAGVRDADIWHIQVQSSEQIKVGEKILDAWHLVRVPRPGSYDQKLDIWLVPQQDWIPARIRYTEKNGDIIDMVLAE